MEDDPGIGVLGSQFRPTLTPFPKVQEHVTQFCSHLGDAVVPALSAFFGAALYDTGLLEFSEAGCEQRARQTGSAFGQLAECGTTIE
jgi:hypothetical protein